MAQEYYSFMMNRFFETLFIQLMASIYYTLHSEHDEPSLTCLATGGSSSFKDFLLGRSKDTGAMAGSSGAVPPDLPLKVDRVQAEAIFCMK